MKKIILPIFFVVLFLLSTVKTYASDVVLKCTENNCDFVGNQILYDPADMWKPGDANSRIITFENESSTPIKLSVTPKNTSNSPINALINLKIEKVADNSEIYEDNISNFYSNGGIVLDTIPANSNEEFRTNISFDAIADDSYQGDISKFDLAFNFERIDGSNNSSENPGSTSSSNNSNNSSGPNNTSGLSSPISTNQNILSSAVSTLKNFLSRNILDDGVSTKSAETSLNKGVLGSSSVEGNLLRKCTNSWLWVIVLIVQIIGAILIKLKIKKSKLKNGFQLLVSIIAGISIWYFFCQNWILGISILVSILGFVLINLGFKFKNRY